MIFLMSSCQHDTSVAACNNPDADARPRLDGDVDNSTNAPRNRSPVDCGFTLTELLISMAIMAVVAAVAIPMYSDHKEKLKRHQAIKDIMYIQTTVDAYALENRYSYPDTLADVKMDGMLDPWKGPYRYTRLAGDDKKGKGSARKDKNLVPINTDYDLWSNGPDGKSVAPLTAAASRDDIVRANNGRFVGPAADY